jgi:hypothetical protein
MEQLKEIKSVAIVPFTLMSSSISAVLGLIYAILLILILGVVSVFLPAEASLISSLMATMAVALILVLPVGSFLFSVVSSFVTALLYNLLVPKIGGIKLGIVEMKEVRSIPVIPVSLMLSLIYTILTFLVMLVVAPIVTVSLQGAALISISATATTGLEGLSALGIIGIIIMVIGVPILVLICSFIFSAISAILYNILAPKIGGVRLKFSSKTGNIFEIKKIPPLPLAIITTVVITIVNFIFAIPALISYCIAGNFAGGLGYFLGNIVGSLIFTFKIGRASCRERVY